MARRIVSLLPAATELISALGLRRQLVGRSHHCDLPDGVAGLPALTYEGDAVGELTEAHTRLAHALAPETVDVPALIALAPDFIVTQVRPGGIGGDELKRLIAAHLPSRPQLVLFGSDSLAGIFNEFQKVADTFGAGQKGKHLVTSIRKRFDQIADRARNSPYRPRTLCLISLEPLTTAGYWVPTLVETAGGLSVLARANEPPRRISWADIRRENPDKILLMLTEPPEQVSAQLRNLFDEAHFRALDAAKSRQVLLIDGRHHFNRPGPRLLESIEVIAEIFHPKLFGIRRLGRGWAEVF